MAFGDERAAKAVQMLNKGTARGSGVEAMGYGIPGYLHLVTAALEKEMEEQLLRHTRAWYQLY